MKKVLLTFLASTLTYFAFSQEQTGLPRIVNDTLITSGGFRIAKGQELKIGTGTMPDGDFKFIRRNSASLMNYTSNTGHQALANQANALPRSNAGTNLKVIRVEERGTKKRGFVYYVVLGGMVRHEVDIENAIESGEVVVPSEYRKNKTTTAPAASAADELKKFKELLDSGAITTDEYNAKKKQLLGI